jgi:hypothetical protein
MMVMVVMAMFTMGPVHMVMMLVFMIVVTVRPVDVFTAVFYMYMCAHVGFLIITVGGPSYF